MNINNTQQEMQSDYSMVPRALNSKNPLVHYESMNRSTSYIIRLGEELRNRPPSRTNSTEKKNAQAFRNANRYYNPRKSSRQQNKEGSGFPITELPTQTAPLPQLTLLNKRSYKDIDKQIIKLQKAIERDLKAKLNKPQIEYEQEQEFGEVQEEKKQSYDFLTNPQIQGQQEEQEEEEERGEEPDTLPDQHSYFT